MRTASEYGVRLRAWSRRIGADAADVRYPRPEAGGDVCAVHLLPRGPARARVLVVHGAGNDAIFPLLELFRALLDGGCEVFAFDVDGHGRGSTTVFDPRTVRTAVAAALDAAEWGGPSLPLHVVGHSLGGALVLDALADDVLERAVSAVVLSAPVEVQLGAGTVASELRGFFRGATLAQREHYGWWGLVPAFGPVKRAAYPFRRMEADGRAWSYVDAVRRLLGEMRLEARVEGIRVPTLLIYGRADRLAPPADGARLAARIPGARLLTIPGATHYSVPFTREAVDAVLAWMDSSTAVAV